MCFKHLRTETKESHSLFKVKFALKNKQEMKEARLNYGILN